VKGVPALVSKVMYVNESHNAACHPSNSLSKSQPAYKIGKYQNTSHIGKGITKKNSVIYF
jgi:hypothetical protein